MRRLPLLTVLLIAVAGCGDTTADETAADGGSCGPDDGTTVTVEIPEFTFEPTPIEIDACDSVVWANTHDQPHTSTGKGDKAWSTDNIAPGSESDPVLFDEAGTFAYICALHPFMQGTVAVA